VICLHDFFNHPSPDRAPNRVRCAYANPARCRRCLDSRQPRDLRRRRRSLAVIHIQYSGRSPYVPSPLDRCTVTASRAGLRWRSSAAEYTSWVAHTDAGAIRPIKRRPIPTRACIRRRAGAKHASATWAMCCWSIDRA
jgi:hypothetical protein